MQASYSLLKTTALGLAAGVLLAGCGGADGPELGAVSGRVTLDGRPLPNAVVQFQPIGTSGTYSAGRTDADGHYRLHYTRDRNGAIIGTHRVSVSTAAADAEDEQGNSSPVPERVPAQYNGESILTHDVKAGNNTIDLELSAAEQLAGARQTRR